ncbi:MAG: hypothetical protein WBE18_02650, partial [Gammaproteobacteria bacterium]
VEYRDVFSDRRMQFCLKTTLTRHSKNKKYATTPTCSRHPVPRRPYHYLKLDTAHKARYVAEGLKYATTPLYARYPVLNIHLPEDASP